MRRSRMRKKEEVRDGRPLLVQESASPQILTPGATRCPLAGRTRPPSWGAREQAWVCPWARVSAALPRPADDGSASAVPVPAVGPEDGSAPGTTARVPAPPKVKPWLSRYKKLIEGYPSSSIAFPDDHIAYCRMGNRSATCPTILESARPCHFMLFSASRVETRMSSTGDGRSRPGDNLHAPKRASGCRRVVPYPGPCVSLSRWRPQKSSFRETGQRAISPYFRGTKRCVAGIPNDV